MPDNRYKSNSRYFRKNHQITASQVRLLDENGKQIGVVPLTEALKLSFQKELDLIEISPEANPPVCRIIAFDKFNYEQQQKQKAAKKKQKDVEVKEFRLRLNIFQNDLENRIKRMDEFLQKGNKIKISVFFRGRENAKKQFGYELVQKIIDYFGERIIVEKPPMKQGNIMICVIGPQKLKKI